MLDWLERRWPGQDRLRWEMLAAIVARGSSAVLSFIFTWLIARLYGAQSVGLFSIALTTTVICATFALTGINYLLVRAVSIAHRHGRQAVATFIGQAGWRVAGFVLPIGLALFLLRDVIAVRLFDDPAAAPYLGTLALAMPALAFTKIASAALRGMDRVISSQLIDGPVGTGTAALILGLAWLAPGIAILPQMHATALFAATLYTGAAILSAVLAWLLVWRCWRRLPSSEGAAPDTAAISIAAGIPILLVVTSNMFSDWFASVALAYYGDTVMVGQFRIAFMIVSVLNLLNVATDSILSPRIARAYHDGDTAGIGKIVRSSAAMLLVLASPALVAMIAFPHILLSLFGPDYEAATMPLTIMALAQIASLAAGPVGTILVMTGHQRWSMAYGIGAALLSALLSWVLVPFWGITGAAVAVAVAILVRKIAEVLIVHWVVKVPMWRSRARI